MVGPLVVFNQRSVQSNDKHGGGVKVSYFRTRPISKHCCDPTNGFNLTEFISQNPYLYFKQDQGVECLTDHLFNSSCRIHEVHFKRLSMQNY